MKNILKSIVVVTAVAVIGAQATLAAFTAQAVVTGNTFSTGNAALRLFANLGGTSADANLVQTKVGGTFSGIYPGWTKDYGVKLNNYGSVDLVTSVTGVYVTDTANLKTEIYVQAFEWNDAGTLGIIDPGEATVAIAPAMTLEQWRTNPIALGELDATVNDTHAMVLRFFTDATMSPDSQGQTSVFNFVFDGTTDGATQE